MKGSQESLTTVVIKGWPTPNAADSLQGGTTQGNRKDPNLSIAVHGPAVPASSSTDGSPEGYSSPEFRPTLHQQVTTWPTPASSGVTGGPTGLAGGAGNREKLASMLPEAEAKAMGCGKLNPRWVETLMGLPVGWTMPSCASPVTIERMNSDSSETVSSQQQQNEPLGS